MEVVFIEVLETISPSVSPSKLRGQATRLLNSHAHVCQITEIQRETSNNQ